MRTGFLVAGIILASTLAGCAAEVGTFRFQASLSRAMTANEAAEFERVTGRAPEVEMTLVGCAPDVDPYVCNEQFVQIVPLQQADCERLVALLLHKPYWRNEPRCIDDANRLAD